MIDLCLGECHKCSVPAQTHTEISILTGGLRKCCIKSADSHKCCAAYHQRHACEYGWNALGTRYVLWCHCHAMKSSLPCVVGRVIADNGTTSDNVWCHKNMREHAWYVTMDGDVVIQKTEEIGSACSGTKIAGLRRTYEGRRRDTDDIRWCNCRGRMHDDDLVVVSAQVGDQQLAASWIARDDNAGDIHSAPYVGVMSR